MSPNLDETFALWRNAIRIMPYIATARCTIHTIQDSHPTPEMEQADRLLEEEYVKQEDILWLYSKDILRYGTDEDREKMYQVASDYELQWNGNDWVPME